MRIRDNNSRQKARETNSTFYISEFPCRRCGKYKRYTKSGNCYACDTARKQKKRIETNWAKEKEYGKRYAILFPEKRRANVRNYQARKMNRTPSWANKDAIHFQYLKAKFMEWFTGEKYHVDHIIPLKGENVCGLHVEYNLQYLSISDNRKKKNRF